MSGDPYSPPAAGLTEEIPLQRSVMWKIYFLLITFMTVIGLFIFHLDEKAGVSEVITTILFIPSTIGLFGYVFSKKILNHRIWQVNFIVYLFWGIAYYYVTDIDLAQGMERTEYLVSQSVGWAISLPAYFALFQYARPSNPLWR
jgi:hypothetical protein